MELGKIFRSDWGWLENLEKSFKQNQKSIHSISDLGTLRWKEKQAENISSSYECYQGLKTKVHDFWQTDYGYTWEVPCQRNCTLLAHVHTLRCSSHLHLNFLVIVNKFWVCWLQCGRKKRSFLPRHSDSLHSDIK